jgi:hypothetical protein
MISVLWDTKLLVGIELADSAEMDVSSKNGDSNGLFGSQMLQLLDEPVSLIFVMLCGPMVVEIV